MDETKPTQTQQEPTSANALPIEEEQAGAANWSAESNGEQSATSSTEAQKKPSKWHKIREEAVEIGIVIAYLAISFSIVQTFRCATLLSSVSENDFMTSYATAGVSALALGKFVFVLEKTKLAKRFEHRELIIPVLYKSVLFTILVNFILRAEEHLFHQHSDSTNMPTNADPTTYWLCFYAHQVAYFVTFFVFFAFREIDRVLGKGTLRKLFFSPRD